MESTTEIQIVDLTEDSSNDLPSQRVNLEKYSLAPEIFDLAKDSLLKLDGKVLAI